MSDQVIFDMTRMMERFIDEGMAEIDIMRELLNTAENAHQTSRIEHFRIGDGTYSLHDLKKIQAEEEHEALVAKHRWANVSWVIKSYFLAKIIKLLFH